jgi:N-acyl-L-homoserine lactone synthetase
VFFTLGSSPALAEAVFRFRTRLFVDELGWSLSIRDGVERDQFDTANTTYCALLERNAVIGCFRAISCDQPYLAKAIFPHLATTASYPDSADALEISRFGISACHEAAGPLLYSLMLQLADLRNIRRLVAIVELSHERLLNQLGLKTLRYGDCHIVGFKDDGSWILGVAGEIPLPREQSVRLRKLLRLSQEVEIIHETDVLGRSRLSA